MTTTYFITFQPISVHKSAMTHYLFTHPFACSLLLNIIRYSRPSRALPLGDSNPLPSR